MVNEFRIVDDVLYTLGWFLVGFAPSLTLPNILPGGSGSAASLEGPGRPAGRPADPPSPYRIEKSP